MESNPTAAAAISNWLAKRVRGNTVMVLTPYAYDGPDFTETSPTVTFASGKDIAFVTCDLRAL